MVVLRKGIINISKWLQTQNTLGLILVGFIGLTLSTFLLQLAPPLAESRDIAILFGVLLGLICLFLFNRKSPIVVAHLFLTIVSIPLLIYYYQNLRDGAWSRSTFLLIIFLGIVAIVPLIVNTRSTITLVIIYSGFLYGIHFIFKKKFDHYILQQVFVIAIWLAAIASYALQRVISLLRENLKYKNQIESLLAQMEDVPPPPLQEVHCTGYIDSNVSLKGQNFIFLLKVKNFENSLFSRFKIVLPQQLANGLELDKGDGIYIVGQLESRWHKHIVRLNTRGNIVQHGFDMAQINAEFIKMVDVKAYLEENELVTENLSPASKM